MVSTKYMIAAAAVSAPLVHGHGYMGLPKVTFVGNGDPTEFATTINGYKALPYTLPLTGSFPTKDSVYSTDPTSNTKYYTQAIEASQYKSLREFILSQAPNVGCGKTKLADKQPLPDAVEWTHGASEGFTPSHEGPCEVWCDDEMVFHDDNCSKNYPSAPAKLPYEKAKCVGKSKLATYWMALHGADWQVYISCAALEGGSGNSGSAPSPAPGNGATPSVKPATPASSTPAATKPAATPAPAPSSGNEYDDDCDDDLPEPGDDDCDEEYPEPGDNEVGGDSDYTPAPTTKPTNGGNNGGNNNNNGGKPTPTPTPVVKPTPSTPTAPGAGNEYDDDCNDDLPEPGNDADDCDDDLPEPGNDDDCDEEYPEPADNEYGNDFDFSSFPGTAGAFTPGKVVPENY
ncbi:hypothetical protein Poli38472_004783 [Pythium oligandrum]|uniref:Uncharacterized protein n=1 Tax=Pythium oligandrum TaxID=41045 RepID=A0A8K1FG76_PYTOL|nr:hypothetical protein Poli38472_004783 [Pythium oligandrum]|eukprot:TMW59714.1 hypothetical protein Poli38472_004783 [Pythium oligandrum]